MSSNVIYLKTKDEIAKMKESGQILIKVFEAMQEAIKPCLLYTSPSPRDRG